MTAFWLRLGRVVLLTRRFFARRESRSALQGNQEKQIPLPRLRDPYDTLGVPKQGTCPDRRGRGREFTPTRVEIIK
jgi:hypothetical protein